MESSTALLPGYSLWQLVLYMLRLGTLGFGGPVALVGYMHRDLVEQRQWVREADYTYVRFGGIPWMQAVFYGVGAAVIGIIALSAHKLTLKSVGKDKLLWLHP